MLTVAIPTFDRPNSLARCLSRIVPQLDSECQLIVVDNASSVLASDAVARMIGNDSSVRVKVVRNPVNIGGNANILRCLELAEGEWVWVVGDDDLIEENAVSIVKNVIRTEADAMYISFCSASHRRSEAWSSVGIAAAIRSIDDFGDLLFISTGVYRRSFLAPNMKYGHQFAYSCAPHLAVLFASVGEYGRINWRREVIVRRTVDEEVGFFDFTVKFLGLPTLVELPVPAASRAVLMKKIDQDLPSLLGLLAFCAALTVDDPQNRWLFGYIARRANAHRHSPWRTIATLLGEWAMNIPRITYWCLGIGARMAGKRLIFRDSHRCFNRL